jgi:heme o synthase
MDYLKSAKPRVVALFVVTVVAAMVLAGARDLLQIAAVAATTALTVAGAAILNNFFERRTDARMERTRRRPTAAGRLTPRSAFVAGLLAILAGVAGVGVAGGAVAAALAAVGAAFYVVVYTLILKPRTALSALPGGLAGVFPAVIGWAAAGAPRSPEVLVLCALIFLWSPAHFWALSLALKEQYAAAGIPTPSVAYGPQSAAVQILAAASAAVALTIAVVPAGLFGIAYAVVAVGAGLGFWALAVRLVLDPARERAWLLYKASGPYLAALVVAMLV